MTGKSNDIGLQTCLEDLERENRELQGKIGRLKKDKWSTWLKTVLAVTGVAIGIASIVYMHLELDHSREQTRLVRINQLISFMYDVVPSCTKPEGAPPEWSRQSDCPLVANLRTRTETAKVFVEMERNKLDGMRLIELRKIRLTEADLRKANLSEASLIGADLR